MCFLLSARFRWALPSERRLLPNQGSAFFGGPQEFLSKAFASRRAVKDGNCCGGSDESRRSAGAGRRVFARSCARENRLERSNSEPVSLLSESERKSESEFFAAPSH